MRDKSEVSGKQLQLSLLFRRGLKEMIGGDFEKGLANMKSVVEAKK